MFIVFESTTTTVRTTLGIILGVTYAIGELLLALCAYYFQSWRVLIILPESIIWLASQSNEDKLKKELSKLAKCNNLDIRVDTFESHPKSNETFVETSIPNTTKNVNRKEEQTGTDTEMTHVGLVPFPDKFDLSDCYQNRAQDWELFEQMFCVSFVYFGTSLGSKSIGSNYLITFICLAAVEIPGLIVGIIAVTKFGRKPVQIILLLVGSIVCYANIFLTYHYPVVGTVLAVIGKGCMSAQWSINVLYTFELFPTVVRNTGYSTASVCARIAVIISAYIPDLAESYPPLPMIIFGSCGLIATIAMLFLPETANRPLLDSVEETNQFDRSTTVITSLYNRLVNKVPDIDC
ncbi:Solute carrier family 22 member 6-A [Nymphon striatum]|nr:Solute carrier family 22 member 6-A [Nymphon striatum]